MNYTSLIAFAFLLAGGQILFKKAALAGAGQALPWALLNSWTVLALVLYLVATALWVWILRSTPLSTAYPFAALGFVIVPLAAHYFFGENIDYRYVLGIVLIVTGIVLTQ